MIVLDFETYSKVDLSRVGAYAYAYHPTTQIRCCAWQDTTQPDQPPQIALVDQLDTIPGITDPTTPKAAHNAGFDRHILARWANNPRLADPAAWTCTMALTALDGAPQGLAAVAEHYGLPGKHAAGTRLLRRWAGGEYYRPEDAPLEWEELLAYARQDATICAELLARLPAWSTFERRVWVESEHVNDRGLKIDLALCELAAQAAEDHQKQVYDQLAGLLNIENPRSPKQLLPALHAQGYPHKNLQAETITDTLTYPPTDLTDTGYTALKLREQLAGTATRKYQTLIDAADPNDQRIRGMYQYHGAHTGRWAGRLVQPQNLPRATNTPYTTTVDLHLGNPASYDQLRGLIRHTIQGPLIVGDYAQIESRILAWQAGETWLLDAYHEGRDVYTETGRRLGADRRTGKIAVLALGYGGGTGALRRAGLLGSDDQLSKIVNAWRQHNPRIVAYWRRLEQDHNPKGYLLPSGRVLHARADSWGGRLAENIVQAIARDLLATHLLMCAEEEQRVVGHVHDELICEPPTTPSTLKMIMETVPDWAEGLPLKAEIKTGLTYATLG